jgi:hypothetical protein
MSKIINLTSRSETMTDILLISEKRGDKPETVVYAEFDSIEIAPWVLPVHFKTPNETKCRICGAEGRMIWTDLTNVFSKHPNRCGEIPVVEEIDLI